MKPIKAAARPIHEAVPEGTPILGHVVITKLIREAQPIYGGGYGTFGQNVDEALARAAMDGEEVQSFMVEIDGEAWKGFAENIRKGGK